VKLAGALNTLLLLPLKSRSGADLLPFGVTPQVASSLDCRAHDLMYPVVADICLTTLGIGDEDEFYRLLRRKEHRSGLVGLFVCGNKSHVPRRNPDEGRHVVVAANRGIVPWCVLPYREDQDYQKRGGC